MLFCQQCGAGNADDARFCNQCGGKIAHPGEPGGPLASLPGEKGETTLQGHSEPAPRATPAPEPPAEAPDDAANESAGEPAEPTPAPRAERRSLPGGHEPSQGFDVSTLSLSAIGVRSRGKAWGVLIAAVLGLIGLGALGTWLAMHGGSAPEAVAQEDADPPDYEPMPPDEVEIGDPLPEGAEPAGDVISGTPRPRTPTKASSPATPRPSSGGSSASSGSRPSSGSSASSGSSGSSGASGSGGSSGSSGSSGASGSGASSGSSGSSGSTGSSGSSGSTGGTRPPPDTIPDEPDWGAMEEEDDEMEEYAARVRSVVRQYYATRAQACFERETRNHQSVRGTVVIGFDILGDGNIRNAQVVRNTTGIDTLGRCLATQVGSWRLPPPPESPLPMQMPFSR